ncbi:MAG: apolipoprotein N-acyltransferase [Deltaproteobacteria bacterium]|nr:apolipoprotein N-acyltransferase [Deltaproteobacteria bacterium]
MNPRLWLRENWKWLAGILVSVVLTFFSYPPHGLGLLMFVALAPVFVAMETATTWKQAAFRTWLYVFLGNAAICTWVAHSVHEFTQLPWVLSYPCILVLSFAEQGSWPVLAALRFQLQKRWGVRPLLWTPVALLFLDVCWPKFFPNTMGNVFYRVAWLSQLADLTGVWGLTALLGMTNELAALLFLKLVARRRPGVPAWSGRELARHGVATAVVLAGAFGYAGWRYGKVKELMAQPKGMTRVAIVQPSVNGVKKVKAEADRGSARRDLLEHMLKLTTRALAMQPDFVFWPETAYPDTYHGETTRETTAVTAYLDGFIAASRPWLLFGGRDQIGSDRFNSLFLVTADAGGKLRRQVYHKTILLELAEHTPLADVIPGLQGLVRAAGGGNSFARGSGPSLLEGPNGVKLGATICLEGLYPRFVRDVASLGADLIVNATNDEWFGPTMEPDLHLYLTAFRAIETRRPLVRSTNTGYSTVVDIDGQLRFKSDLMTEAVITDDVPLYEPIRTPFMIVGDWLIAAAGIYALAWLAFAWRRNRLKSGAPT